MRGMQRISTTTVGRADPFHLSPSYEEWTASDLVPVKEIVIWTKQPKRQNQRLRVNFILENNLYEGHKFAFKIYDKGVYRITPSYGILEYNTPQIIRMTVSDKMALKSDSVEMLFKPVETSNINWRSFWRREKSSNETDDFKLQIAYQSSDPGEDFFQRMPSTAKSRTRRRSKHVSRDLTTADNALTTADNALTTADNAFNTLENCMLTNEYDSSSSLPMDDSQFRLIPIRNTQSRLKSIQKTTADTSSRCSSESSLPEVYRVVNTTSSQLLILSQVDSREGLSFPTS